MTGAPITGRAGEAAVDGAGGDPGPRTASVAGAVDALAEAAELAEGRLDQGAVVFARSVVEKAEGRLRHGSDHTLVAMLGATGSGKSSLTNAIAGSDVATTGVRRPTTSSTLACVWGPNDPHPLLDWLGVNNRHRVDAGEGPLSGLVLLDVPDHDSVAEAHRMEMEFIAERADLLIWVTDPEKYADRAMHGYLRTLDGHGAVMAMVLNKADLLRPEELGHCRADLTLLLQDVGLYEPEVLTAAAGAEPPEAEQVRRLLTRAVADRRAMTDRLGADVHRAAGDLLDELGPDVRAGRTVSDRASKQLASDLVDVAGLEPVCDAVEAGHRRDAVALTGWPFTRWARALRPHPLRRLRLQAGATGRSSTPAPSGIHRTRLDGAIRSTVAEVSAELPPPWPEVLERAGDVDRDVLHDRLDTAVAGAARSMGQRRPRWWRAVNLLQMLLALAVVAGLIWLGLLALAAYLQLPDIPTPSYRRIPVPTGLLIIGGLLGLLVALLSRWLAAVGARRRSRAVRRSAEREVAVVADELVIEPLRRELAHRTELRGLLERAAAARQ
ncbi:MAG: GTPase [Actinomycetota bacterium]